MANEEHVALLRQGVDVWNAWRRENPDTRPDFSRADLRGVNLTPANVRGFSGADLREANFSGADLRGAQLLCANFAGADLRGVNLSGAEACVANFIYADLREAVLVGAALTLAYFIGTQLQNADLTDCHVYGVSAWGVQLAGAKQQNLVVTDAGEHTIAVVNIEVSPLFYTLLHNEKIRDIIDTIGKKGVLLLGRFTEGRIQILERLQEELRSLGYVPMVFNFDKPETKDFTETVQLLANLSHFVIVDITNPRSAPLELQATVPDYMVPFVPILEEGQDPFAMFVDLQNKYDWVLKPVIGYSSVDRLIEVLEDKIVRRAEAKFNQLLERRHQQLRVETV
jgi:hypothetical protein